MIQLIVFILYPMLIHSFLINNNKLIIKYSYQLKSSNIIDLNGIKTNGISINSIDKGLISIRGIVSTKSIDNNQVIISVPAYLAIETTNTKPPTPFPTLITQNLWINSKWDHRLAYKLIYEVFILKDQSKLSNWINNLPNSFSTTFYWNDTQINQLQYDHLTSKIIQQRDDWSNLYNTFLKQTELGKSISYKDFVWSLECVNSRAFSGKYEGSSGIERLQIVLFTSLLSILWPILQLGTIEQSLATAITVLLSILLKDVFVSKFLDLKRYVVCPYIDMFNHQSNSELYTTVSYNYYTNSYEIKSNSNINANTEVCITYGKQSNDRLLQFYGFVEQDNPNDLYDYNKSIIELLLEYDNDINEVFTYPTNPSPEERIKYLTNGLASNQPINHLNTLKLYQSIVNTNAYSICKYIDRYSLHLLRGLLCSNDEWNQIQQSNQIVSQLDKPISDTTEDKVNKLLQWLINKESTNKATSLEYDKNLLDELVKQRDSNTASEVNPSGIFFDNQIASLLFRIEKKKLLTKLLQLTN